jgi:hypothetical protein
MRTSPLSVGVAPGANCRASIRCPRFGFHGHAAGPKVNSPVATSTPSTRAVPFRLEIAAVQEALRLPRVTRSPLKRSACDVGGDDARIAHHDLGVVQTMRR